MDVQSECMFVAPTLGIVVVHSSSDITMQSTPPSSQSNSCLYDTTQSMHLPIYVTCYVSTSYWVQSR